MGTYSQLTMDMVSKITSEYPPQTREEEAEMCRRHADKPEKLQELLVYHNLPFMMEQVKNYKMRTVDKDDFFMYGVRGLVEAAKRFDPSLGKRFTTLAEYYIKKSVQYVFSPTLVDVKTNMLTSTIYDAPTSSEDMESATIGDWLAMHSSPANWAPPDPAESLERVREAKENKELVDWLCNYILPDTTPESCFKACKFYMRGMSMSQICGLLKIRMGVVKNALITYIPKIAKAIARAKPGTELHDVLNRHKAKPKERVTAETVYAFLCDNRIKIARQVETETERVERLMGDFDAAVALKSEAMGRYGVGADFSAMRMVYELHVKGESAESIGRTLGIPVTYAMFLRERGVALVKEYLSGRLNVPTEAQVEEEGDEGEVRIVQELDAEGRPVYLSEQDEEREETQKDRRERFVVKVKTSSYDLFQKQYKTIGRRSRLVTTFGRMRGGYYTMEHYLRLSGKRKMTLRQVEMMIRLQGGCRGPEFALQGEFPATNHKISARGSVS